MISHALTIVKNEINAHLSENYGNSDAVVDLGNLAEGFSNTGGGLDRDKLYLSVVNIKEDKTLKNIPHRIRNDISLQANYENPPVFINFLIMLSATHANYTNALSGLSRAIRFFQYRNVFTQENVAITSLDTPSVYIYDKDKLESFRLIFDLYSPSLEEVNHLWGTLGGKQYPFVLYMLRMLDLRFKKVQKEVGLITEIVSNFSHKENGKE